MHTCSSYLKGDKLERYNALIDKGSNGQYDSLDPDGIKMEHHHPIGQKHLAVLVWVVVFQHFGYLV